MTGCAYVRRYKKSVGDAHNLDDVSHRGRQSYIYRETELCFRLAALRSMALSRDRSSEKSSYASTVKCKSREVTPRTQCQLYPNLEARHVA